MKTEYKQPKLRWLMAAQQQILAGSNEYVSLDPDNETTDPYI